MCYDCDSLTDGDICEKITKQDRVKLTECSVTDLTLAEREVWDEMGDELRLSCLAYGFTSDNSMSFTGKNI